MSSLEHMKTLVTKSVPFFDDGGSNQGFLILILTLMLLVAMFIVMILLAYEMVVKWYKKDRSLLISHGGSSIPLFVQILMLVSCGNLILQIVNASILISQNKKNGNGNENFTIATLQIVFEFFCYSLSLLLILFVLQKLMEKYESLNIIARKQLKLYSWINLSLFSLTVFASYGVAVFAVFTRLMQPDLKSHLHDTSNLVQIIYFSSSVLLFLYCSLFVVYYLTRYQTFSDLDAKECVNLVSESLT
jgi:hypothetical protein